MTIVTIPKELIKKGDLVLLPLKEYEGILRLLKERTNKDWICEEPFLSELKRRIKISKKELKTNKILAWKKF